MSLVYLVLLPFVGGALALFVCRKSRRWAHAVMLVSIVAMGVIVGIEAGIHAPELGAAVAQGSASGPRYVVDVTADWIPSLGIDFHLGADGLALVLLGLTVVLGVVSLVASWRRTISPVIFAPIRLE